MHVKFSKSLSSLVATALLVTLVFSIRVTVDAAATINTVTSQGSEFNFLKSDKYEVTLSGDDGATWQNSFVYKTTYNLATNDPIYDSTRVNDTVSYTDFASDYSQTVTVKVKLLTGNISSIVIRPSNYSITPTYASSNTYTFTLTSAKKVSVEINESSERITHKLFVFANNLESSVPNPSASDVYQFSPGGSQSSRINFSNAWGSGKNTAYFGKGLYYITEDSFIPTGKTVYLAPGAYVFGSFKSVDPTFVTSYDNITIRGRGVIDSIYGIRSQIYLQGTNNKVDGVTLLNKYKGPNTTYDSSVSASWLVGIYENHTNENKNVKVINFMHAGGIFGLNGEFKVDDCFIFTNDDCIDISFPDKSIITNNTTWNYYNGSALCVSWNTSQSSHVANVDNLNVIHWDSKYDDPGCSCGNSYDDRTGAKIAVIFASHDSDTSLKNFTIQNVRVEKMSSDSKKRLLSLCVYDNAYSVQNGNAYHGRSAFGGIDGFFLKNITIDGTTTGNVIAGYDSNAKVSNVTFENLKINGSYVYSEGEANLTMNQYTSGISFIKQNKVSNWSFEADAGFVNTPSGWNSTGTTSADYGYGPGYGIIGDNSCTHYSASAYSVTTYQTITGLSNGTYTATAMAVSSGGQTKAAMSASNFGGTTIETNIPTTSTWTKISIPDIVVSNGQCTLSFISNAGAGQYIRFDDVQLFLNDGTSFFKQLYSGSRNNMTGQLGYKFKPSSNITITALGRQGQNMIWNHGIKVFQVSNSSLIANATVTPSSRLDLYGYRYSILSSPVNLTANVEYYITSTESNGADTWMDWGVMSNHRTNCSILGSVWDSSLTNCPSASNFYAYTDAGYCAPVFYTTN